jgi:uncharacterized protein (DUF1810 family)
MADLSRFYPPQDETYADALEEIRGGRKTSHWMWWIFPQLASLGVSDRSRFYGLSGLAEARAYLADPVLAPRLVEAAQAMLAHADEDAADILGEVDAKKLRSSATLFAAVEGAPPEMQALLAHADEDAADILGEVDAKKLRSSATLFAAVEGAPPEMQALLDAFFGGEPDPRTLALIEPFPASS